MIQDNTISSLTYLEEPTNSRVKPFIRWAGGKQNLVRELTNFLPNFSFSNYYEPFIGAGSLFFYNNFKNPTISDINPHLINTYISIKKNPEEIFERIEYYKERISKEYYYKLRILFNKNRNEFTFEQASIFILLVQTSFNGIFRVNKKGEYNVPFGKNNPSIPSLLHLKKIQAKLIDCNIINAMYDDILSNVNQNDFVYLDPPYPPLNNTSFFQHYTIDKFPFAKQEELAGYADSLSSKGSYIMISNADTNEIRKLYKNWNLNEINTFRYINCKSKRKYVNELIITNY